MAITIQKIAELEYNELVTLRVIELDEDSTSMLREYINQPFTVLYKLSKENLLSEEQKGIIRQIFDYGISANKLLVDKYLRVLNTSFEIVNNDDVSDVINEEPVTITEVKVEVKQTKSNKELPRRYGSDKILKDINKQHGKPTNVQLAALSVNKLKNIYVNLNSRLIKDMLLDRKILSDEDYREIKAVVTTVERKLELILKKR